MGFFIFMVVAGIVVYNLLKNAKASQEQWRIAAERLGLGYHAADFGMTGTISGHKGGHRIVISTFSKSGGNNSNTYTKYRIDYRERVPVDFRISRQSALHAVGHAFGLKDIETGNPSFDERALVRGIHPQNVQKFLTPERQTAITNLLSSYSDVVISNEMIELNKPGKEKESGSLIRMANSLLTLCNDLTDLSVPSAKQAEKVVEIEPVEPSLNPFVSANPVVPEPPMVEAEQEPVPEKEPDEVVIETAEPAETPVDAPPAPAEPTTHAVLEIAQDLYGGDAGSAVETQPRFEELYLDRPVSGAGIIQRVSKLSYDPVFKGGEGVKVTCEVGEVSGAYSTISVRADVVFPSERLDELTNKVGASIPISGRLIAQNTMLHHLYIISDEVTD